MACYWYFLIDGRRGRVLRLRGEVRRGETVALACGCVETGSDYGRSEGRALDVLVKRCERHSLCPCGFV